jgi:hypothetical protein
MPTTPATFAELEQRIAAWANEQPDVCAGLAMEPARCDARNTLKALHAASTRSTSTACSRLVAIPGPAAPMDVADRLFPGLATAL